MCVAVLLCVSFYVILCVVLIDVCVSVGVISNGERREDYAKKGQHSLNHNKSNSNNKNNNNTPFFNLESVPSTKSGSARWGATADDEAWQW